MYKSATTSSSSIKEEKRSVTSIIASHVPSILCTGVTHTCIITSDSYQSSLTSVYRLTLISISFPLPIFGESKMSIHEGPISNIILESIYCFKMFFTTREIQYIKKVLCFPPGVCVLFPAFL